MHYYNNTVGIIIFYNNNSLKIYKSWYKNYGNLSFFVIFYDFVMKCVYKSTIHTFVIRDKIWTPPLCCTKVYMLLLCFGSRKHPPTPIHVRHFCVSPPPVELMSSGYQNIPRGDLVSIHFDWTSKRYFTINTHKD